MYALWLLTDYTLNKIYSKNLSLIIRKIKSNLVVVWKAVVRICKDDYTIRITERRIGNAYN